MPEFRIARIIGFDIRVDSSWFIIVALILWSFSMSVFPAHLPGYGRPTYLVMGAAGTVLFFTSLLLHELSHAFAARTKRIPVDGITLFIFGGMALTRMEAQRPRDEFIIAGVGPLMSLLLSVTFYAAMEGSLRLGLHPGIASVAYYLAILNLMLAVFNMLPGFPLDGGRVLRSVIWKITGDFWRATRIVSLIGLVIAYLVIAYGVWQGYRQGILSGLWFVFVGWFLRHAASVSYRQSVSQGQAS